MLTGVITALFITSPAFAQQGTPQSYLQGCLFQISGVPSESWYQTPTQGFTTFKMKSDLYKTTDQANTFLRNQILFNDYYENTYKKLSGWTEWYAQKVDYTKQTENFFYFNAIDKFAGLTVRTNKADTQTQWHGFESNDQNSLKKFTTARQSATLPKNIKKVSFVYEKEQFQLDPSQASLLDYNPEQKTCDGKFAPGGQVLVYYDSSKTTGYVVCLENAYYRVQSITFEGDGSPLVIGTVKPPEAGKRAVMTYEIPPNHVLLGLESFYTEITQYTYTSFETGTNVKSTIEMVGWFNLVTIDQVCAKKLWCRSKPSFFVDPNSNFEKVIVQWSNVGNTGSSVYTIQYGPNFQYSKTASASAGRLEITENIVAGQMQFRLNTNVQNSECGFDYPVVTHFVQACLPQAPTNVLIQTTGACPATNNQISITWNIPFSNCLPIDRFEVSLSNSQYGSYTRYDQLCNGWSNTNSAQMSSCQIPWNSLAQAGLKVGEQIWVIVKTVNRLDSAQSKPSGPVYVNNGPSPITQIEAKPISDDQSIMVKWMNPNGNSFSANNNPIAQSSSSCTYTLRGRRQGGDYVIIKTGIPAQYTLWFEEYRVNKANTALGNLECGVTYEFQVQILCGLSCSSQNDRTYAVVYSFEPGAPKCVVTKEDKSEQNVEITWQASEQAKTCPTASLTYQIRIVSSSGVEENANSYCDKLENNKCTISIAKLKSAPFFLQAGDQVVAKVFSVNGAFQSQTISSVPGTGSVACEQQYKLKGCPSEPLEVRVKLTGQDNAKGVSPNGLEIKWTKPKNFGDSINQYIVWIKNNNGKGEDKLKPILEATIGDTCAASDSAMKSSKAKECSISTNFNSADGLAGANSKLFEKGQTICIYMKAYNSDSANKCNWEDPAGDATKKQTVLGRGSNWSVDYSKTDDKGEIQKNCVTWLECATYKDQGQDAEGKDKYTEGALNLAQDTDLTNWFELWIKWDAPIKDNNGGAEVAYYEIIYYKKDDKWTADSKDVVCDDYAQLDDDDYKEKKKEKKIFKLTSTTNKIGIPGLVMNYEYHFCIRPCNGVDKCSTDCKFKEANVKYAPPALPNTPLNFKEIESETCCTYMTITWTKNPADNDKDDKNSRDYWGKEPKTTDIESYIITYYLKRDPNLSPQSIVITKAADIIYDKDQGQCKDKTEEYPYKPSQKQCKELDENKRWPEQKDIDNEKIKNLFQMKYKITQNVIPGETYVVQVSARSKVGPSFATDPIEIMAVCCPTAPHSLRTDSSKSFGTNIVLTWEKATSECSPIVSHEILQKEQVKDQGIQWSAQQSLVADNFWTKKNAAICQEYEFAVIAKNKKCRSPVSNLYKLRAAGKPDRPSMKPCKFDAVNGEFTFEWTKSNTDTCAPVTDYLLRVRNGFSSFTQVNCPFSTQETCTVKASTLMGTYPLNLKWGDELCPIVSASNKFGASLDSFESSSYCCKYQVEHDCPAITKEEGTEFAKTTESKDDFATFQFKTVTPKLGGAISYKVQVKRNGVWGFIDPNPLPAGVTTFTVRGLSYDQTYELQVIAYNDAGESQVCTSSSCKCTIQYKHRPTVCPNPPQFLRIEQQSSDVCTQSPLTLTWTEPIQRQGASAIDGYRLYYRAGSYEYQVLPENTDWTKYKDEDLSSSTKTKTIKLESPITPGYYTFYVKAYVGECVSQASNLKQFEFVSGDVSAPTPVATSSCGSNSINLSWYPSQNAQVTGYKVMMATNHGQYFDIGNVMQRSQNSMTIQYDNNKNVLQKGVSYSFKLIVLSSTCSWNEKASTEVTHSLSQPPTQPGSATLNEVQSGKYCLRWVNTKSLSSSQTKNYRVEYQAGTNGYGTWQNAPCDVNLGINSRECCFTPINQNSVGCASYTARVTALSDCSESTPAVATTTQQSKPAAPTLKQQCAAQNSQNSIALQWGSNGSSCNVVTSYIVEYEQANIGWFNVQMVQPQKAADIQNGVETSIILSGTFKDGQLIKPGFVYNFRISACNSYGCTPSNVVQASTNSILTASNMPSRIYIQNCGIGFLRVFWKEKYSVDPQFKFLVFGKNQQPQEVKCFNYANDYNICLIHTDILRQAPYNLQDGQEFTLQVMAANGFSTGTQFQSSCGGVITNAVVQDTYTLPPRCINVQTCPFQYFDETLLLVKDVPNVPGLLPSAKSAVPSENDVPPQALDELGLEKNSQSNGKQINSFNIKLENGNSTDDNSSSTDHINLKDSTIENGFTDAAETNNDETENFGLGIFAGIGMILLIEVILVGGFYIYSKKSQNQKKSETRAAEQDESHLSSRDLNNGTVPAEEEDFSATMKNINGNSIFVDRQTAQQNKIEHEV